MAEVVLVVGTEKVAEGDLNPNHPMWFVAFESGREPSPESVLKLVAVECQEPRVLRLTAADCQPSRVVTSSSGIHVNLRGH